MNFRKRIVDFLISIHQYYQEAFFQASKYFYFHSPKEKFSKKTPKNAKNLDKILRGGCAKSDQVKKVEFFPDFPKRGLPWKALKLQGIFLASENRFLSRLSKNETAVENIGKSKVNIENFEKLKNRKTQIKMSLA